MSAQLEPSTLVEETVPLTAGQFASPETQAVGGFGVPDAIEERPAARVIWREALHRRSLGVADFLVTTLTVAFVLRPFGHHAIAVSGPAAGALLLVLFKMAGLYDRDDLRLVHSTLDEIPLLAQLTGLFALCVGIIETTALGGA